MTVEVMFPSSDYNVGSAVTKTPGTDSATTILTDSSDGTYVSFSSSATSNAFVYVMLANLPVNVLSISAASITLRALSSSTKNPSYLTARLFKSDGTTGLCSVISGVGGGFGPTTSFSNLTENCSGLDTTVLDWNNAILLFQAPGAGNGNTLEVSQASVNVTVTLSATDTGLNQSFSDDANHQFGTSIKQGCQYIAHRVRRLIDRVCPRKPRTVVLTLKPVLIRARRHLELSVHITNPKRP
jgi:hypothetical protein